MKAATAYAAICRAGELAPDDESIQQERERVETWITRLVDDAKLESFPESWTFERRALWFSLNPAFESSLGADATIQATGDSISIACNACCCSGTPLREHEVDRWHDMTDVSGSFPE